MANNTHFELPKECEHSLKRQGWEYIDSYQDEKGHYFLEVVTKGESNEKLHEWRTQWGYIGFMHHMQNPAQVMFYTC